MALGSRIRQAREARGLTPSELAQRVTQLAPDDPLSPQSLRHLEDRDSAASKHAARIADALEVSIRWLLDGVGEMGAVEWPFPGVDVTRVMALTRDQRIEIQGKIREMVTAFEAERRPKKR